MNDSQLGTDLPISEGTQPVPQPVAPAPQPVAPEPAPVAEAPVAEAPAEEAPVEEEKPAEEKAEEEKPQEEKGGFKKPKLEKTAEWQLSKGEKDRLLYAGGIFIGIVFVLIIIAIIISVLPFCNKTCSDSLPLWGLAAIPMAIAGTILLSWFAFNKVNKKELKKEPLLLESGKPSLETFTKFLMICYGVSFGVMVIPQAIYSIVLNNMCRADGFGTCGLWFKLLYYIFAFTGASVGAILLARKIAFKKFVPLVVVKTNPNGTTVKKRVAPKFVHLAAIGASILAIVTVLLLANYHLYS